VWGARSSGRKWPQVALVAAASFFTALLIGALLLKASSLGSSVEELVQRGTFSSAANGGQQGPCLGSNCTGVHDVSDAAATAAAGSANTLGAAGAAAGASSGSSNASKGSSSGAQAGQLPRIFLFIGILSARGYRHRRLAVREAWANKAQTPGQVVAKFILSENEHTPQVGGDSCMQTCHLPKFEGHCAEYTCCWQPLYAVQQASRRWRPDGGAPCNPPCTASAALPHLCRLRRSCRHMAT
jgi:hypothetical protein